MFLVLSPFMLIGACKNQFDAPIAEDKLVKVLKDVHIAEALLETENQTMRDSFSKVYYAQIFEHHGITRVDFDSTMSVYARYPEQFDSIYSRVERLIKSEKDTLQRH